MEASLPTNHRAKAKACYIIALTIAVSIVIAVVKQIVAHQSGKKMPLFFSEYLVLEAVICSGKYGGGLAEVKPAMVIGKLVGTRDTGFEVTEPFFILVEIPNFNSAQGPAVTHWA